MSPELRKAIQDFFGDTSRSREETLEGLEEARDEIEMLLECMKADK